MVLKLTKVFLLAVWLTACSSNTSAEVVRGNTITPQQYQSLLGKGMDVNWVKTNQGMRFYNPKAPADFKARGLQHVRIRVVEDATPQLLAHLQQVVDDSLKSGLIPIIAYRGDALELDPLNLAVQQAFLDWWQAVAEHFKAYPPELAFNLIIEVSDKLKKQPDVLNAVYARVIPLIRQSNPRRILIAAPINLSAPEELYKLRLPEQDGYMMAEWHFYAAGPSRKNPKKQWTNGNPAEQQLIRDKIAIAKDWQAKHIPTWVGAWMANNFKEDGKLGKGDYSTPEQVRFAQFVAGELDKAGIPFAVNSDTKFYDREIGRWIEEQQPVLDVILQPKR